MNTFANIFDYDDFPTYLKAYVAARKLRSRAYSVSQLNRKVGNGSVSLLHMILAGKRAPTLAFLERLRRAIEWNDQEFDYAVALTGSARARTPVERELYRQQRAELKKSFTNHTRSGATSIPAATKPLVVHGVDQLSQKQLSELNSIFLRFAEILGSSVPSNSPIICILMPSEHPNEKL